MHSIHVFLTSTMLSFPALEIHGSFCVYRVFQSEFVTSTQHLYSFGGSLFWAISEVTFAFLYVILWTVRFWPLTARSWIPPWTQIVVDSPEVLDRRPMVVFMALHFVQAVGAFFLYCGIPGGLCLGILGFFLYISTLGPLLFYSTYGVTSTGASVAQPTLLFSYSAQVNDHLDDDLAIGGTLPVEIDEGRDLPPILRH